MDPLYLYQSDEKSEQPSSNLKKLELNSKTMRISLIILIKLKQQTEVTFIIRKGNEQNIVQDEEHDSGTEQQLILGIVLYFLQCYIQCEFKEYVMNEMLEEDIAFYTKIKTHNGILQRMRMIEI